MKTGWLSVFNGRLSVKTGWLSVKNIILGRLSVRYFKGNMLGIGLKSGVYCSIFCLHGLSNLLFILPKWVQYQKNGLLSVII